LSPKVRLENAQRELATLRARLDRSSRLTLIIGTLILIVLAAYFYYGSKLWAEITEPESLVTLAEDSIDRHLPKARESLQKEIIASAPSWAVGLSKQLVDSIPDARKKLEKLAIKQLDSSLQEASLATESEFRKVIKKNRPVLDEKFKELIKSPKLADQSMAQLVAVLEEDLETDLRDDAAQLFKTLKTFNENWRSLMPPVDLTEEGRLERRMWTLARRLFLEQTEPGLLEKPPAKLPKLKRPIKKGKGGTKAKPGEK
jgi:hypothetical protein